MSVEFSKEKCQVRSHQLLNQNHLAHTLIEKITVLFKRQRIDASNLNSFLLSLSIFFFLQKFFGLFFEFVRSGKKKKVEGERKRTENLA